MNVSLIVAIDKKGGISKNGQIPFSIKEDQLFFQDVTKRNYGKNKNAVIMGKNTYLAMDKPLPDRVNIVVSSTLVDDRVVVVRSLSKAIDEAKKLEVGHIFICGGKAIYEEAFKFVTCVYVTYIDHDFECDNCIEVPTKYHVHKNYTFDLVDSKTGLVHVVNFNKMYYNVFPEHWIENKEEAQYLGLLEEILNEGDFRKTRNGNTWSLFSKRMEFDLSKGFPALTTKRIYAKGVFEELAFFLRADTNANHLAEKGVHIWDKNTTREFIDSVGLKYIDGNMKGEPYLEGDMGPMYFYQLFHYNEPYKGCNADYTGQGFNQIEYCLDLLKNDPHSRRIIMTTYNPSQAMQGVLFPCHSLMVQFYVEKGNKLSANWYNRSTDSLLGLPFNIYMAALLIIFFCEVLNNRDGMNYIPGRLVINCGDIHIYEEHREQCIRQILRDSYDFPQLKIKRKVDSLVDFKFEDIEIENYSCYPGIKAEMVA